MSNVTFRAEGFPINIQSPEPIIAPCSVHNFAVTKVVNITIRALTLSLVAADCVELQE